MGWEERRDFVWNCIAIDQDNLSSMGMSILDNQFYAYQGQRQWLMNLLSQHPEIEAMQLAPPIIVTGLPRSGTTHLHRLLASTGDFQTLPIWQALDPFGPAAPYFKRQIASVVLSRRDRMNPEANVMHEQGVDEIEEETSLLSMDFSSMEFETMGTGTLPSWRDEYLKTDQTPHYEFLRSALKALTWLNGEDPAKPWLLKSPQHMEQIPVIHEVFPGATVVKTERFSMTDAAVSFCTLIESHAKFMGHVDPRELGAYWLDRFHRMNQPSWHDVSVPMESMRLEGIEWCEHIYDFAGLEWSARGAERVIDYDETHQQYRHGKPSYDRERYGL